VAAKNGIFSGLAGAAMLLCLLAAGGCGGGGSGDGPPTKEAFVRQANAICTKGVGERDEIIGKITAAGRVLDRAEQLELVVKTMPSYEQEAVRVGELTPPAGDEKKIEAIVRAMKEAAASAKADPGTTLVSLIQFKKANELVEAYGLDKCIS
jgi:hypothetical protein